MSKFIRFINQGINHFFIINGEYFSDGHHEFKNRHPDSFTDRQFMAIPCRLPEEFSDGLIVNEAFHGREYVVLESHAGGACNKSLWVEFGKTPRKT